MKDYYVTFDDETEGYAIYRRYEDVSDEKICVVFSVDHTEIIIDALEIEDNIEHI